MSEIALAVIGGSGLYNMAEMTAVESVSIDTPFGRPSDSITVGTLHGRRVAFLPRHGRGHVLTPTEVPYRANIFALKTLGARYIVSVSACGSLREDFAPGEIVVPDQLFDFTKGARERSFFGNGLVAHVAVAQPFCPHLSAALAEATEAAGGRLHRGGSVITVEGPRFSTKAESRAFRAWGMDIIGMTTTPEAQLAREAEMSYAVMAHVTDYDVWHESETPVTVEMVIQTLLANTAVAKQAVANAIRRLEGAGASPQAGALRDAIITNRAVVSPEVVARLAPLIGQYFA